MGIFSYLNNRNLKNQAARMISIPMAGFDNILFKNQYMKPERYARALVNHTWRHSKSMLAGELPLLLGIKPHPLSVAITTVADEIASLGQTDTKFSNTLITVLGWLLSVAQNDKKTFVFNGLDIGLIEKGAQCYLLNQGFTPHPGLTMLQQVKIADEALIEAQNRFTAHEIH
jgi:hypothetical protein